MRLPADSHVLVDLSAPCSLLLRRCQAEPGSQTQLRILKSPGPDQQAPGRRPPYRAGEHKRQGISSRPNILHLPSQVPIPQLFSTSVSPLSPGLAVTTFVRYHLFQHCINLLRTQLPPTTTMAALFARRPILTTATAAALVGTTYYVSRPKPLRLDSAYKEPSKTLSFPRSMVFSRELKVKHVEQVNHDTKRITFELPGGEGEISGVPASCM
jgi:hypothetical protein